MSAGGVDAVVAGGAGFIGGHLVRELLRQGLTVRSVDVRPLSECYQVTSDAENLQLDLSGFEASRKAVRGARWAYNLAADMGGMGFIENNRAYDDPPPRRQRDRLYP